MENFAIVFGVDDVTKTNFDILKINLHRPSEVQLLEQLPSSAMPGTCLPIPAVAVRDNIVYVVGIGRKADEIWKYNTDACWNICANLDQGRGAHEVAFVDEVLYICGGRGDRDGGDLESVETYNTVNNECTTVGNLAYPCLTITCCILYNKSLYIFGGSDKYGNDILHVQVYNTKDNTCVLFKNSMPQGCVLMRAVLWKDSAILLGTNVCLVYNFVTETWREKEQFRTDVVSFGLTLLNDRLYVIGGSTTEEERRNEIVRDDVRYLPVTNIMENKSSEWKEHTKLPKPIYVVASGMIGFNLQKQ